MTEENVADDDGRLSFAEAVHYVRQRGGQAFAAAPVFGELGEDDNQRAEGVRIFLLEPEPDGDYRLRFIAGPFFSAAYAANEVVPADEIPDGVKEMRFMPTRCEEEWLSDQIQLLVQKLVQASGRVMEQMPDYASAPDKGAGPEAVFPVSFVGRDPGRKH